MEQRLLDLVKLIEKASHDLRTPAAAIRAGVNGIKQYLPTLLSAYETAKINNLEVQEIQPAHLKTLSEILDHIEGQSPLLKQRVVELKNKTIRI